MAARLAATACVTSHGSKYHLPAALDGVSVLEELPAWVQPGKWYYWLQTQHSNFRACLGSNLTKEEEQGLDARVAADSLLQAPPFILNGVT